MHHKLFMLSYYIRQLYIFLFSFYLPLLSANASNNIFLDIPIMQITISGTVTENSFNEVDDKSFHENNFNSRLPITGLAIIENKWNTNNPLCASFI